MFRLLNKPLASLFALASLYAQQPSHVLDGHAVTRPRATINQPYPLLAQATPPRPDDPESDPAFRRLSPQDQGWLRVTAGRPRGFPEQKELEEIHQIELNAERRRLTGMNFCGGNVISDRTYLDAFAFNESHTKEAYIVRWLDPEPGSTSVHSAIFTTTRCIASSGEWAVDRWIARILPESLAISKQHGLVAYEALFRSDEEMTKPTPNRRGVFIENHFLSELPPLPPPYFNIGAPKSRDFWWDDEKELLVLAPNLGLTPIPAAPASRARPAVQPKTAPVQPNAAPARPSASPQKTAAQATPCAATPAKPTATDHLPLSAQQKKRLAAQAREATGQTTAPCPAPTR